jgi:hypothetical protein
MSHTNAEIKNLFHLIFFVPFMVIFIVLLFNGLTSRINANSPAINGNIIIMKLTFGSSPRILRSFGLAANWENTAGFVVDFRNKTTSSGTEPILLAAIRTATSIITYLQKLFLPAKVDSRWFIIKNVV